MPASPPPPRLRSRLRAWREGPLLGPVLTLVTGTTAAQAVVFAARPALTRLFTPEAFGVLTVFTTVLAVGSTVASGGYRSAVLLPRGGAERANVLALALGVAAAVALVAGAAVWAAPALGLAAGATALALGWLPAALFLNEAATVTATWHTGRDRFRAVSWSRVAQSLAVVAVQLGVGVTVARESDWSAVGLVAGVVVGAAAAALVGTVWLALADGGAVRAAVTPRQVREAARRYVRFPSFSAPAALLNVAATRVPVFALVAFYGEAVVGQYGLAFGTLALPLGLVTGAVGQAFFARAAEARWTGDLAALTRSTARGLWGVAAFPCLAVLAAGPALFAVVFGAEWLDAGLYARRIAPWVLLASVVPPLTPVFDVLERQRDELAVSGLMFVVQSAAMVAAGLALDPLDAVLVAGVVGTGLRLVHLGWALRLAGVRLGAAAGDAAAAVARSAPFAAAVGLVDLAGASGPVVLGAAAVAGVGALGLEGRRALARPS